MAKMIFVSLPVSDVARSTAFYEAIGLTGNAQFSDHTTSCLVFSDAHPGHVDDIRQVPAFHQQRDRRPEVHEPGAALSVRRQPARPSMT